MFQNLPFVEHSLAGAAFSLKFLPAARDKIHV